VIGCPFPGEPGGKSRAVRFVRVHSGRDGHLLYAVEKPEELRGYGYALAGAGDVNRDGVPDFAVAQHDSFTGNVWILSGRNGATLVTAREPQMSAEFPVPGYAIDSGADVNGDGFADVLVARYSPYCMGHPYQGAYVVSGKDGRVLHQYMRSAP
jgi:FG-GAP-like repeat